MNKNAIKKFATEARRELISRVSQRALQYGISDKETGNPNDDSVGGHLLSSIEKKQRAALIQQIKEKGYEQVMEEVAYTWFNRFSALRFMEVNGYLPSRVRVFTDENNAFKPQILTEAIHMELDGLDMEKVYAYKDANDDDGLYKYLLITQCNALNSVLPGMFQKIEDYTELLFPDNLLREGSVVQQMIELIPEEDWKDAVQIIGWLYQYYNSEKKDEVFAALKKNVKITKENIPAATQLFTPDWIVRYMVENSLGRLWVEGHPNDELKSQWKYYLEEAEQEPEVQAQLATIREEYKALKPEDILCIDPCSGSGHILAYMFDVLVQIYEAYGVDTRTAVASIVENNIYGLDIDDRAAQLAYFSVMMKACQYDKRFLRRKVQPHVYAIVESNHADRFAVEYFCNGDEKLKAAMDTIIDELHDAKEYGSIITVSQQDWNALYARFDELQNESVMSIYTDAALELRKMVDVAHTMAQKYYVVVTNPPYMGSSNLCDKQLKFIKSRFPKSKKDLFATFIEKSNDFLKGGGLKALITQYVWMYKTTYTDLRLNELRHQFVNVVHLGPGAFEEISGEVVNTVAFVVRKANNNACSAIYIKLDDASDANSKEKFFTEQNRHYYTKQCRFFEVSEYIYAYWVTENVFSILSTQKTINAVAAARKGLTTGDNDRFVRLWFEVDNNKFSIFGYPKWFPMTKGGLFRKWYGNNEYVVNWENNGHEIKNFIDDKGKLRSRPQNTQFYLKEGISWNDTGSGDLAFRYQDSSYIPNASGPCVYSTNKIDVYYLMGMFNSKISRTFMEVIAPALKFEVGQVSRFPVIYSLEKAESIIELVKDCVDISKQDWDSIETSWDFVTHPLITYRSGAGYADIPMEKWQYRIADAYHTWESNAAAQFDLLKKNEEELNRIFIDIYGLQDELTPEVEDKDVTVRKADLERDIKSFISYAVGCMFGRYSLNVDGLVYAGGEWDNSKYSTFVADKDNIIPISDDEYFEDDMVGRFVKFVEIVYGKDTLQENLKFIADALGGKGQPKDVIRNYFLNGFYGDHCKMYQKRPIYWMFDSGKKNGFKCLIYMHRYQPDTLARIRTDYVHEQQARYRTAIADVENRITNAATSERVKLKKQLKTLTDQAAEIHEYEEKIHHLADQMISIDLDDGVKKNYAIFKDVLAKTK